VLKWPNDVLIGQRKVAGLLCEGGGSSGQSAYVVVGVGINVNTRRESFPEELGALATSLRSETGRHVNRAALLAGWLAELEGQFDALWATRREDLGREYTTLCSTLGHRVRVDLAGGQIVEGLADSLGPDGSLRVKQEGGAPGALVEIRAGDVIHLRYDAPCD
jgi:BirA family biotin operon repressor/biotin-[acetyl-CoA-carboxylase] ligase